MIRLYIDDFIIETSIYLIFVSNTRHSADRRFHSINPLFLSRDRPSLLHFLSLSCVATIVERTSQKYTVHVPNSSFDVSSANAETYFHNKSRASTFVDHVLPLLFQSLTDRVLTSQDRGYFFPLLIHRAQADGSLRRLSSSRRALGVPNSIPSPDSRWRRPAREIFIPSLLLRLLPSFDFSLSESPLKAHFRGFL